MNSLELVSCLSVTALFLGGWLVGGPVSWARSADGVALGKYRCVGEGTERQPLATASQFDDSSSRETEGEINVDDGRALMLSCARLTLLFLVRRDK